MKWGRSAVLDHLKGMVSLFLRYLRASVRSEASQPEQHLQLAIDTALDMLQKAGSNSDFDKLTQQIKMLLHTQTEVEQQRIGLRLEAMSQLISAVTTGLRGLSEHSEDFTRGLNQHIEQLISFVAEEQSAVFRERFQEEFGKLQTLLEERSRREEELTQALQQRTQEFESELAQANEEMQIDALTRLHNRRALDSRLLEDIAQHSEYGGQFAVLLFDVDHFKKVNDTHGHVVGDKVLQALAQMAKQVFSQVDFVARYGGEEFAVLLYDAGPLCVQKAAERFRLTVSKKEFQYAIGEQPHNLRLTVSIGVSHFEKGDTAESIVQRADQALYLAKDSGRNQIMTDTRVYRK